jgi:hypothetical protein
MCNSLIKTVFFFLGFVLEVEAELGGLEGAMPGSGFVGIAGDEIGRVVGVFKLRFLLFLLLRNDVICRFSTLLSLFCKMTFSTLISILNSCKKIN